MEKRELDLGLAFDIQGQVSRVWFSLTIGLDIFDWHFLEDSYDGYYYIQIGPFWLEAGLGLVEHTV